MKPLKKEANGERIRLKLKFTRDGTRRLAFFYVEGANLLVPSRVNFNFKRILSPFASFFKGFIGAGGWNHYASVIFGHKDFVQLNDGASVLGCPVSAAV